MAEALTTLLDLLGLERIEENLFRGGSQDLGWGRIYGGQVVAQALSAAEQTVPDDRRVHSLHAYFLRPGDPAMPVVYTVDPIRDGRSFTTRRVVAVQKGKAIFNLSASFQADEPGFEHAEAMPDAPDPDTLKSASELAQEWAKPLPEAWREKAMSEGPIEIRPVDPINPLKPHVTGRSRQAWFRTRGTLPDDPWVHQYLLAYASDFHFLTTTLQPHGVTWLTPGIQIASLDHAMWFHRPFRLDDWLLYSVTSPSASGARALAHGHFFDRQGRLVASTSQEGLIRDRRDEG